jgi:hypothetical protein
MRESMPETIPQRAVEVDFRRVNFSAPGQGKGSSRQSTGTIPSTSSIFAEFLGNATGFYR